MTTTRNNRYHLRCIHTSAHSHLDGKITCPERPLLGGGDRRRDVFCRKTRGPDIGCTKKGKGTKIMLMVDGEGTPISLFTVAANYAEVHAIEILVDERVTEKKPKRLLYDKAADADWLRESPVHRNIELICP